MTPPRRLGRYELIGQLARGGMGTVYLARHAGEAGFQRLFAIKILHEHLAEEDRFIDMLHDEARLAARIHHPNVVGVVDMGTVEDRHYVVMDYVEGPALSTLWKRSTPNRPIDLLLGIAIDTLEGLHVAHVMTDDEGNQLNLVHRDVSPQNILVGVDGVARLTDFGIAKAESRISSTQPGMRKGKIQFMSPEQIREPEAVDARSDIWAMGVLLWSLLANQKLFKADNDAATVSNILKKEVVPPSTTDAAPPACLDAIVLRALERDPAQRFSSAIEMADALRQCAYENRLVGSRQRVAAWVGDTFAEELKRRRDRVREVARRPARISESADPTRLTTLPPLRSSATNAPPEDTGSSGLSQVSETVRGEDMLDAPQSEPAITLFGIAVPGRHPARTLGAAGVTALLGAALLAWVFTGATDRNAPASVEPPSLQAQEAAPAAAALGTLPEKPRAAPSPALAEESTASEQEPALDRDPAPAAKKRTPAVRRGAATKAPRTRAAASAAHPPAKSAAESAAPERTAAGAVPAEPRKPPSRATESAFESNPYLRH